jgi:ankyrin repeat protein
MNAEIDFESVEPSDFSNRVSELFHKFRTAQDSTTEIKAAQEQVRELLVGASQSRRVKLFQALTENDGTRAMEFAASEGLTDVIPWLHKAGVDPNANPKAGMTPLIYAAMNGYLDAVTTLMDCGATLMPPGSFLNALSMAIEKGHTQIAAAILARSDDLSSVHQVGDSVLDTIATYGGAQFVPIIVSKGGSPHKPNKFKKTPLAVAAENGRVDVMQALLATGASPDAPPLINEEPNNPFIVPTREVPLILAAKNGHDDAARLLIQAGTDVSATDHQGMNAYDWARKNMHLATADCLRQTMEISETAFDGFDLIQAAKRGYITLIKKIVESGVDVDFRDRVSTNSDFQTTPGRTALMWAASQGQEEAVKTLLDLGASPDQRQEVFGDDKSVWELAALANQIRTLEIFIERAPTSKFLPAALRSAAERGNLECMKLLLDHGVDVNAQGKKGETVLITAANKGQTETIRLLLQHGVNLELRTKGMFASPALHYALLGLRCMESVEDENGNLVNQRIGDPEGCVRLLIEAGADPNSIAKHGDYPLQHAVGFPEIVRLLIEAGANLELTDKVYKQTPLRWAVLYSDIDSVRLLLDAGAFHSPVNKEGETPLDIARKRDMTEIVALLEQVGAVSGKDTPEGRAALEAKFAAENAEEYHRQQAIAASEALKPDFSSRLKTKKFTKAIERLESLTGVEHSTQDNLPGLAVCRIKQSKAEELAETKHEEFHEFGCTLFCCGVHYVLDGDELLGILPTTDPLEVIAAIGTGGANYDIFTSDIVAELKELYDIAPFRVSQVCYDRIALELVKPLPKAKVAKWATRLYKLCPDLVDQGFLSLKKLRDHLSKETQLFLWWD